MGGGCGFFDFDNDGDQDLLLVNSARWDWDARAADVPTAAALYRNDGHGQFEDITAGSGLDVPLYGMGCAFGDYDGDGATDIYLTAVGPNQLFHNEGGGTFKNVTTETGVAGPADAYSTAAGWFDYDADGDLDLLVLNYVIWSREKDVSQNFQLTGGGRAYGRPQAFEGTAPLLFRNDGNGFTEVAAEAGLVVYNPASQTLMAKSLGLTLADADADGDLDVFISNDTVQNFLFINNGDGTFQELGVPGGIAFDIDGAARGAMGIDAATLRNGQAMAVAIGNFANEMTALYVTRPGELQFSDEAVANGLGPQTRLELTFGLFFFDADLDGRLDLFAANGHLEEDIHRVQPSQFYEQAPQLFWNAGADQASEFVPLGPEQLGTAFVKPMVGRGAAYADIDGDGDLDVLIASSGGAPRLLRNDQRSGSHWLRVRVVGSGGNRQAIGASVLVQAGDETQQRLVMPTRSYLSQVELPVTFGLGTAATVARLEVRWPSGAVKVLENVPADRLLVVEEAE